MTETTTYSDLQVFQYDPTRTLTLRNSFVKDMDKRFNALTRVITEAIVEQDCFGLSIHNMAEVTPPIHQAFNFPSSAKKVEAFMKWLRLQEERGLLETVTLQRIGDAVEQAWTNLYIYDSYKRGVIRARSEMKKANYNVPDVETSGGVEVLMDAPFHVDRVGLAFIRTFEGLKGITAAMDMQISQILAQGLVDGDGPRVIARKLVAVINGSGMGDLGITDSIGRFIPAKRRAQMLARTEIIRAHHLANIQEYKNWRVLKIKVIAEWSTAGDDRVCDECASLHGNRYTLEEIEHMIPVHPNCRCIAIPVENTDPRGVPHATMPRTDELREVT